MYQENFRTRQACSLSNARGKTPPACLPVKVARNAQTNVFIMYRWGNRHTGYLRLLIRLPFMVRTRMFVLIFMVRSATRVSVSRLLMMRKNCTAALICATHPLQYPDRKSVV